MEWGMANFAALLGLLPPENFEIFFTGTKSDGEQIRHELKKIPFAQDLTGKLTLDELMSFIAHADGLIAASTGPLHIAAALGTYALGLYSSRRPMHPGRWAPLGINTDFIEDGLMTPYHGPLKIQPQHVADKIKTWRKSHDPKQLNAKG
jgi:ADP-heptose:LPS heptosyltransferase